MSDNQDRLNRIKAIVYPHLTKCLIEEAILRIQYEFGDVKYKKKIREILGKRFGGAGVRDLPDVG